MGCSSSQQHRTKVEVIMTLGNNICQQLIQLKNYIMYHNNLAKNKPRLCIIYTLKVLIYIDNNIMIQNQISCEAKNYNTKQKIIALAHLGQAEKQNKGTKPLLQLTWAGQYKKRLIIGLLMVLNKTI